MAFSLVIDPSIAPFFSTSSSSTLTEKMTTLPIKNLHFHGKPSSSPFNYKPTKRFPFLYINNRTTSPSAHQTSSAASHPNHPTDVKTLIHTYKKALFDEDETTISEIETIFRGIEIEKNRFDQKVLSLSMKIASEKETKIRLQADFDNARKKLDKDKLSTEYNAKVQIMKNLLPIIDSFEIARQQIKPDTDKEKKIDTSYQGIYRQFVEVLRHLSVKAIATVGKPFDPLLHEAISREESETVKAGIITEELSRGFLLGDRVLRSAKVKVSLGPSTNKTPSATEETRQPST